MTRKVRHDASPGQLFNMTKERKGRKGEIRKQHEIGDSETMVRRIRTVPPVVLRYLQLALVVALVLRWRPRWTRPARSLLVV